MFSKENARSLRNSLGPMDFHTPAPVSALLQAYRDFYGLNFGTSQLPVDHAIGVFQAAGFDIVCQHFQIPVTEQRATVFLVHGYFDHAGLYSHLIRHCLQSGYSVVVFDLPGHGLSSGVEASINSFREYSSVLMACLKQAEQQNVHSPWMLFGQSTGGAIIMEALLENQLASQYKINAYVLLAPLIRPKNWFKSYLLFQLTRWFLKSSPRTFSQNSHDTEFLDFLKNSDALQSRVLQSDWVKAMIDFQQRFSKTARINQRLHIIQGSGDGTVEWQYNVPKIIDKFAGSVSYMIPDAGHHLVNESAPFREKLFSLVDEILASNN